MGWQINVVAAGGGGYSKVTKAEPHPFLAAQQGFSDKRNQKKNIHP
jgi:hypothetical protein